MNTKTKATIWVVVGAVVIAGIVYIFGREPPFFQGKKSKVLSNLINTIESDKQTDGKYKRRDKEIINGREIEVHEYKTPKGKVGYQIFIWEDNLMKSIGYGVEAEQRTFEIPMTTTSTKK